MPQRKALRCDERLELEGNVALGGVVLRLLWARGVWIPHGELEFRALGLASIAVASTRL